MMTIITLYLSGCSAIQTGIAGADYLGRAASTITISSDTQYTTMDIDIPDAYGDIPAHPDDPGSITQLVDLDAGSYPSLGLGVDFSPLPYETIENFKLGYKATFPITANKIREGLSDMEWYESGADAATFSRVELPDAVHSIRASWRQPIPLIISDSIVEAGLSYDFWKVKVRGGWDRFHDEESLLEDKITCETLNPFVRVAINIFGNTAFGFYWKQETIEGDTPYGDVDIKGNTYGLEFIIPF